MVFVPTFSRGKHQARSKVAQGPPVTRSRTPHLKPLGVRRQLVVLRGGNDESNEDDVALPVIVVVCQVQCPIPRGFDDVLMWSPY